MNSNIRFIDRVLIPLFILTYLTTLMLLLLHIISNVVSRPLKKIFHVDLCLRSEKLTCMYVKYFWVAIMYIEAILFWKLQGKKAMCISLCVAIMDVKIKLFKLRSDHILIW